MANGVPGHDSPRMQGAETVRNDNDAASQGVIIWLQLKQQQENFPNGKPCHACNHMRESTRLF